MNRNNQSPNYQDLLEAAQAINAVGEPIIEFPLHQFKTTWLERFLDDTDERVRVDWAKTVTASPYVAAMLIDGDGNHCVLVPPLLSSNGDFIVNEVNLGEFISRYNYAKSFAKGHRATNMMEQLAKDGVKKSGVNVKDLQNWVEFYAYFEHTAPWIENVKKFLNKMGVQNYTSGNSTTLTSDGASDDFDSADSYEPL